MSIILKSNQKETELPTTLTQSLKTIGLEEEMDKDTLLQILNQSLAHTIALGDTKSYQRLNESINEIS